MSKLFGSSRLPFRLTSSSGGAARSRHRAEGDAARGQGDWARAAAAYARHLAEVPDDFDIHVQHGHALKEAGDLAGADAAYESARALRPDDADLLLNIGHLHKRRGSLSDAAYFYRASFAANGNEAARHELSSADLLPFVGAAEERVAREAARSAEASAKPTVGKSAETPARNRFVGVVDAVEGLTVTGWAVDPDDAQATAEIELLVDDRPVGIALAQRERPDVYAAGYGTRRSGFVALLNPSRLPGDVVDLHVRLRRTGEPLTNSPVQVRVPPPPSAEPQPPLASTARVAVVKAPPTLTGDVALFVTHAPSGMVKPHVRAYLTALQAQGIATLLIIAADRPTLIAPALLDLVDGAIVRENAGYDFAAWAHALAMFPQLLEVERLYLLNDSVFGPSAGPQFGDVVARVRASSADLIGLTETLERGWHIQSYFLVLGKALLASYAFQFFLREVRILTDKDAIIDAYEARLAPHMRACGFSTEVLFPVEEARNPALYAAAELLEAGFPFVKLLLLKGAYPHIPARNLRRAMAAHGFDDALLTRTLAYGMDEPPAGPGFPLLACPPSAADDAPSVPDKPFKVAFYGPWNYDNGLGAASRGILSAIRRTGVRLNVHPLKRPFHIHRPLLAANDICDFEGPADIAVVHLNPDSWHLLTDAQRAEVFSARKRIGYWVWEMDHIPNAWRNDFASVDRIWSPSGYCADVFAAADEAPVDVVPHAVALPDTTLTAARRATVLTAAGVPKGNRAILYVFDGSSYLVRKNPHALVRAFAASKLAKNGWTLLLKAKHLLDRRDDGEEFAELALSTPGVVVLDRTMAAAELAELVAAVDIYASPHCSEGFGLTVAEAMAAGKPVVATDFGGPRDFLDNETGYPVTAFPTTLDRDAGHYTKGGRWATIDETALAKTLVSVAAAVEAGTETKGAAARARIAQQLSYDAVAAAISTSFDKLFIEQSRNTPASLAIDAACDAGLPVDHADLGEQVQVVPLGSDGLPDADLVLSTDRKHWLFFAPAEARVSPLLDGETIRAQVEARPDVSIFYADDVALGDHTLDRQLRLKPAFDPVLFAAQSYIETPLIVRASVLDALGGLDRSKGALALDDLILRAVADGRSIAPIPRVMLAHVEQRPAVNRDRRRALIAASPLFSQYRVTDGLTADTLALTRDFADAPAVSIVIPTRRTPLPGATGKTAATYIERVLEGLAKTDWPMDRLQVVVGDDVTGVPAWAKRAWPFALERIETPRAKTEPFNYAGKMNRLWRAAAHEHIVMLNDDVDVIQPGWLRALMTFAVESDVGGVGPRLLYEDGTIQHAGIVLGPMRTCVHAWLGRRATTPTYQDWALVHRGWSAVTGAVFATRRAVLDQVNGFDEAFTLEFNDVDLCLRMRQAGYRIIYTPHAELVHAEKASRAAAVPPAAQLALFLKRWNAWIADDPAYHPAMRRDTLSIAPAMPKNEWYQA